MIFWTFLAPWYGLWSCDLSVAQSLVTKGDLSVARWKGGDSAHLGATPPNTSSLGFYNGIVRRGKRCCARQLVRRSLWSTQHRDPPARYVPSRDGARTENIHSERGWYLFRSIPAICRHLAGSGTGARYPVNVRYLHTRVRVYSVHAQIAELKG